MNTIEIDTKGNTIGVITSPAQRIDEQENDLCNCIASEPETVSAKAFLRSKGQI